MEHKENLKNIHQFQQQNTQGQKNQLSKVEQMKKPFIGSIDQSPEYMRDFKLQAGYRINFNSYRQVFKSLFQLHNQTVNIWTHFGGAIIMVCIICSVFQYQIAIEQSAIKFQNVIKQYDFQSKQCHAQAIKLVQETLIPVQIKEKLKNKICHPHGEQYFGDFVCQIASDQIKLLKNYVLTHFGQSMKKIEKMKLHWQLDVIPNIVHEIQKQSNFTGLNFIKQKVQELKKKMDTDQFNYLQFGDHTANPQNISRFPLIIFLLCAIICLGCSTAFHLFNPMSSRAYNISIGLDYAGINVFISGAVFPAFYYGMYCYFNVAYFYMIIIMLMGTTLFILSLSNFFRKPQTFVLRSICYGGFSFFLTIPITHLVINQVFFDNYGDEYSFLPSLHWYILGGLSFLLGLIVFTKRCPDRNHPGKYDLCGHSHQTWHTFVLLGMFLLYFGACKNYQTRKQYSCPVQY